MPTVSLRPNATHQKQQPPQPDHHQPESQTQSSYETFKYIDILYDTENSNNFMFTFYDHCKRIDELSAFVNSFGILSSHSGTSGDVVINLYAKNDIYSCTLSNIESNTEHRCSNLHYSKYRRCRHDVYRQFGGVYDYIFEILVENHDYLIFDKVLLDDYFIELDRDISLTNVDTNSKNKAVIGFSEIQSNNNNETQGLKGIIIEEITSIENFDITFGFSANAEPESQIIIEAFDSSNKFYCGFVASWTHNNNDDNNYLCVHDPNLFIDDTTYNYIKYSTVNCISEQYENKMKITIDY
eukprot:343240_1